MSKMNKFNKFFLYALTGCLITFTACSDDEVDPIEETPTYVSDFEDLSFPEGEDAFYGQDLSGEDLGEGAYGGTMYGYTYTSGQAIYNLVYTDNEPYSSWNGVAYSRQTDNILEGTEGQFVAMPGAGAEGSEVYAIMHMGSNNTVSFEYEAEARPQSIMITNNAYAYSSMQEGDQFSKQFGGVDGNDPDFFRVVISGLDEYDMPTASVVFYLADFRPADNSRDYIVDSWEEVDLTPLGSVHKISFTLESSDVGEYGMNTPAYFAFDNLVTQPAEAPAQ